jgi:hypothetical protein
MKRFTLFTFLYLALGGSKSELDDGSHFTSVFAANSYLTVCRNLCRINSLCCFFILKTLEIYGEQL